ncbi:MAG: peptidoglycan-binding protein [Clostridia bacterium]|nr:peptidoglycan-binding protein [Clostridia bacterium]MBQ1962896.1 peptidoglycan-binding protein [Clostridia bacterium]MBQ5833420.1 peptidoglycan-binding protein [Clostridia bacterium]
MPDLPTVPERITVHLGPPDSEAENVTLPFLDYVANVASSEIYPTWPESAIRANMYAQISFALNRLYTEYYRTRGYDFDITSTTANDQFFVPGRDIFENIRDLSGELFNNYIRRIGNVEPLFAQYCNGTTTTCNGLSQWGSVSLAEEGLTPFDILTYYYGDNIELVRDAPIENQTESAPSIPLQLGSTGDAVRTLQIRLNRISANYPSIPKIIAADGIFANDTDAAVRRFQEIFNLTPDGIVGRTTWYTIQNIYIGVKRLTDLSSEGITREEVTRQYPGVLQVGSAGDGVRNLQYFLSYLSQFYETIPPTPIDGIFGDSTRQSVEAAQRTFGLPPDGVVGEQTWNRIYRAYVGIVRTIPTEYTEGYTVPYGGVPLRIGSESDAVTLLQEYLNYIGLTYPEIPQTSVTGYFGPRTQEAVLAFQNQFGLSPSGVVASVTWNAIIELYNAIYQGALLREGQHPGFDVGA